MGFMGFMGFMDFVSYYNTPHRIVQRVGLERMHTRKPYYYFARYFD